MGRFRIPEGNLTAVHDTLTGEAYHLPSRDEAARLLHLLNTLQELSLNEGQEQT